MYRLALRYQDQLDDVHCILTYLDVVNEELFESIRTGVPGLLGSTITDVWHQVLTLEPSSHPVVNTLWSPPVFLQMTFST